jgi:drug/metabolite transporter (DMT)-like permease
VKGRLALGAAAVFGLIALLMYGPDHFFFPRLWWVVGVLLGYAGVIRVGSELCLLTSYRQLGEPVGPRTVAGAALILSALALGVDGTNRER